MEQLPLLKTLGTEMLEVIFVPRVIAKQLLLLLALETGMVTLNQLGALLQYLVVAGVSSKSRLIRKLQEQQNQARTQDEWMELAEHMDQLQGHDVWRTDPNCPLYERDRITARIDEYVHLMRRRDIFELMFVLRGSIGRNKYGLLHEGLFSKAAAGSKVLVETYHNVVCAALDFCCDAAVLPTEDPIPTEARLAFFNETRHAYGRTALLLSGGAALGFYHVGVVRALMENRLLPRVLGGASAGSIVCAMVGTRTDEECLRDLFNAQGTDAPGHSGRLKINFFRPVRDKTIQVPIDQLNGQIKRRRGVFSEVYSNTAGAFRDMKRTLQGFVPIPLRRFSAFFINIVTGNSSVSDMFIHDTEHFRECLRANVGNFTFQEAFDRTGRILNIVVTPQNASDPPRLLNYLTAPHVLVWSAAVASSSLPGVFEANRLVVKEADGWERYESGGDQAFQDGSLEQDLPMQTLSEMFNINHFIISQANPHAVMFASYNQKQSVWTSGAMALIGSIMTFLKDQVRTWLANLVECVGARRIAPFFETNRLIPTQFFTQEYEGRPSDISLVPWKGHRGLFSALLHIIYNPSEAEFREWAAAAERETWKHMPAIKSHIAEEMTLDRCVQRLRLRMVQESWQKQASTDHGRRTSRVPSFFTSASLTNLGGLSIADQPTSEELRLNRHFDDHHSDGKNTGFAPAAEVPIPNVDVNSGWGGMGLKGNRSSGNLRRSNSDASGLFIDDEGNGAAAGAATSESQPAGERPEPNKANSTLPTVDTEAHAAAAPSRGYIKTTSMAYFYYRRAHGSADNLPKSLSTSNAPAAANAADAASSQADCADDQRERRKSKSHIDLEKGARKTDMFES